MKTEKERVKILGISSLHLREKRGWWDLAYYFPTAHHILYDENEKVRKEWDAIQPQWIQMRRHIRLAFALPVVRFTFASFIGLALIMKKGEYDIPLVVGAVAFDAYSVSAGGTGTSVTLAHTVAAVANTSVSGLGYVDNDATDSFVSMTYNGDSMGSPFKNRTGTAPSGKRYQGCYYGNGTGSGASENLIWTINVSKQMYLWAVSHSGANQSAVDSSADVDETGTSPQSFATTVVASDAALVALCAPLVGSGYGGGTNTTMVVHADSNNWMARSTANVGSGSQSLAATFTGADDFGGFIFSVGPPSASVTHRGMFALVHGL